MKIEQWKLAVYNSSGSTSPGLEVSDMGNLRFNSNPVKSFLNPVTGTSVFSCFPAIGLSTYFGLKATVWRTFGGENKQVKLMCLDGDQTNCSFDNLATQSSTNGYSKNSSGETALPMGRRIFITKTELVALTNFNNLMIEKVKQLEMENISLQHKLKMVSE